MNGADVRQETKCIAFIFCTQQRMGKKALHFSFLCVYCLKRPTGFNVHEHPRGPERVIQVILPTSLVAVAMGIIQKGGRHCTLSHPLSLCSSLFCLSTSIFPWSKRKSEAGVLIKFKPTHWRRNFVWREIFIYFFLVQSFFNLCSFEKIA